MTSSFDMAAEPPCALKLMLAKQTCLNLDPTSWHPFHLSRLNITFASSPLPASALIQHLPPVPTPVTTSFLPSFLGIIRGAPFDRKQHPAMLPDGTRSRFSECLEELSLCSPPRDAYGFLHCILEVVCVFICNFAVLYGVEMARDGVRGGRTVVPLRFRGTAGVEAGTRGMLRFIGPGTEGIPPILPVVEIRPGAGVSAVAAFLLGLAQTQFRYDPTIAVTQVFLLGIRRKMREAWIRGWDGVLVGAPVYVIYSARVERQYLLEVEAPEVQRVKGRVKIEFSRDYDPAVPAQRLALVDAVMELCPRLVTAGVARTMRVAEMEGRREVVVKRKWMGEQTQPVKNRKMGEREMCAV